MIVNTDKSHLLLSSNSRATATIDKSHIDLEDEQVLLVITTDSNFTLLLKTISIVFVRKQVQS